MNTDIVKLVWGVGGRKKGANNVAVVLAQVLLFPCEALSSPLIGESLLWVITADLLVLFASRDKKYLTLQ